MYFRCHLTIEKKLQHYFAQDITPDPEASNTSLLSSSTLIQPGLLPPKLLAKEVRLVNRLNFLGTRTQHSRPSLGRKGNAQ